ncbi:hypothetical protein NP233_g4213 [Leucocoprinus birnbaumii]|uniref:Uncharacterized protein n=1 Tax=Leucocoprinus birnbaumii TaxID=56174 RepID=A0AAD5VV43_9AGAR|nr:hypothetical protein NP233_g4213 [Leucocoprinus birnbaumii]
MSSTTVVTYAGAAAQSQSPAKYVPVHRRANASDDVTSHRSASPTPSEASTATLVAAEAPAPKSRTYSITTLLHLAHDPEIKLISLAQKEKLRETAPEIVMNRKMRKALEYHAIQERVRAKALTQPTETPSKDVPHPHPISDAPVKFSPQPQRQRPGMRRPGRPAAERRPNVSKAMDAASWRTFRLPSVAV